jgi:hypothetical protein
MKNKFYGLLAVAALASVTSVTAYAADTCTGGQIEFNTSTTTATNDLLQGSTSCNMAGYTFSNFDVYTQSGFALGENVELIVTTDSGGTEGLLALSVTTSSAMPSGDYILTYTITSGVTNMTLLDGTASSIEENICSSVSTYGESTACVGSNLNLSVLDVNNLSPTSATSVVTFHSSDVVTKDIQGGSESYQQIVPEPMTFSLLGVGLLGLGLLGRRRARK